MARRTEADSPAGATRATSRVVQAALDNGHEPSVDRTGARFRLVCSCGWKTAPNVTRKNAFAAVSAHVYAAGHTALLAANDTPERVNLAEVPTRSGGRG